MPIPKKKAGERVESWRSRIIKREIEHGKEPRQAVAIAYKITKTDRKAKRKIKKKTRK
jgi:hypothetical protein